MLIACSGPAEPTRPPCAQLEVEAAGICEPVGVAICGEGFHADGAGGCAATLPEAPCGPDAIAIPGDKACVPVGVATCAEGFATLEGGCRAILPASCAKGTLAIPSETACREVATCDTITVPTDAAAIYVDPLFVGTSDGSKARPYASLVAALATAKGPVYVVLADGAYEGAHELAANVHLLGRCPARTVVRGTTATPALVLGAGATVTGIAVEATATGIEVRGKDVRLSRTHIRDTGGIGILVSSAGSVSLDGVLVEACSSIGVAALGALQMDRTVVRGTRPVGGVGGRGVDARSGATVEIARSVVESNTDIGVFGEGAKMTLTGSVVRDTRARADGKFGRGVTIQADVVGKVPGDLTLRGVIVERSYDVGVGVFSSSATIDATTIVDTRPRVAGVLASGGIIVQGADAAESTLTLTRSLVARSAQVGIAVIGSKATVESTIVRDTVAVKAAAVGGIAAEIDPVRLVSANLTLRRVLVERSPATGLRVFGSSATVSESVVRTVDQAGGIGRCINVQKNGPRIADLSLSRSRAHDCWDAALFVAGATARVDASWLGSVKARSAARPIGAAILARDQDGKASRVEVGGSVLADAMLAAIYVYDSEASIVDTVVERAAPSFGVFGDGIVFTKVALEASLLLTGSLVRGNARAGVSVFGGKATLGRTILACNAFNLDAEAGASLVESGPMGCGCSDALVACVAASAHLDPVPPPSD